MAPKKDKSKEKQKAKCDKCVYYNTGYCKKGEDCPNKHPENNCEDPDCLDENCDRRHPIPCKFGIRCRHKRRSICIYLHATTDSNPENFKPLENKFNKKFTVLEKKTEGIQDNIEKLIDEKFTQYEQKISNLRKDLEVKNTQINALEMRMDDLEKDYSVQRKQQEKKRKNLETFLKQKSQEGEGY